MSDGLSARAGGSVIAGILPADLQATQQEGGEMLQDFKSEHFADIDKNPTGGRSTAVGITIDWQDGPLGSGPNRQQPSGAFVETVIAMAIDRIECYQNSRFQCKENALTLVKLKEALYWLEARTKDRVKRNVEGENLK